MISGDKHRKVGDPHYLKRENTKSHHARKGRDDKGLTPTEQRRKAVLMRQFMKNHEGTTNSAAYMNSPVWCRCGRGMNRPGRHGDTIPCSKCRPDLR